jgi:dienelactone hydrolase
VVIFAHGSGSSRHSPRNRFVARVLREAGIGTLLFDLLTREEEVEDSVTGAFRFDIKLLARRLLGATMWMESQPVARGLKPCYFGASTGGGAALLAAAALGEHVAAVVSRGGRPDLAGEALPNVKSPTLLIVGGLDDIVIRLNEDALAKLRCEKELRIIPGASHLFEERGKLEEVARISAEWFRHHMTADA